MIRKPKTYPKTITLNARTAISLDSIRSHDLSYSSTIDQLIELSQIVNAYLPYEVK